MIYLGYRFVLKEAIFQNELTADGNFEFKLSIKNVGYAGVSKDRPVNLVLKHLTTGNSYSYELNTDIRKWINEVTVEDSIDLDETMETGDYQCYLHLPDGFASISDRSEFAIRLGNTGI